MGRPGRPAGRTAKKNEFVPQRHGPPHRPLPVASYLAASGEGRSFVGGERSGPSAGARAPPTPRPRYLCPLAACRHRVNSCARQAFRGAWLRWLERSLHTAEVGGSSPLAPTLVWAGQRPFQARPGVPVPVPSPRVSPRGLRTKDRRRSPRDGWRRPRTARPSSLSASWSSASSYKWP